MAIPSDLQGRGQDGRTVMEEPAPAFSKAQAESIALRAFEIRVSARPLASERDQNFRLFAEEGREWVLKIANPAEDPAILDMQSRALLHIAQADPGLPVPRIRPTREGALFHEARADDGRRSLVRVVSFLPGELLDRAAPHLALARDVGAMAARLARALRGFSHPASRHALVWDLTQVPDLRTRTQHIDEPGRRRLVEEVLDRFSADVLPRLRQQRAQVIHNDVSRMNTLVDGHRVNGVIDFGDMIHAPLVCDLAVPIAELLTDHPEPIATAAEITAGYHAVTPLTDDELGLIFDLAATRSAMSLAVAYWRVRNHPGNSAYITDGVEDTAALLGRMREWGTERVYAALRRACAASVSGDAGRAGTHPSPRGPDRRSRG